MTANKRERSVTAQLSGKDQSMGRMENEIIVKMLQDGQGDQQQLLEMLWKQNVSLVRKIIQESTGIERWNQDFEDLEQQAFLGILESISRYDFSQGNRFFTYATHYIVKSLRKYYDRYCQSLRIPPAMRAKIKSYMRAREELPDIEICRRLHIRIDSLERYIERAIGDLTILFYGINGIDPDWIGGTYV